MKGIKKEMGYALNDSKNGPQGANSGTGLDWTGISITMFENKLKAEEANAMTREELQRVIPMHGSRKHHACIHILYDRIGAMEWDMC
jgi:hypothetical protein